MNFSGAIKKAYQSKNTSIVFIGDSITWGYGLRYDQTIHHYIQDYLNNSNLYQSEYGSKYTTPTYWGWADNPTDNTGMTIVGRNLHMDDLAKHSWLGYGDRKVFQQPIYSPDKSKIVTAGFGFYPFSSGLGIDGGLSSVAPLVHDGGTFYWNNGSLSITPGGQIQFKAKYPSTTGNYLYLSMQGAGTFTVSQGSTVLRTDSVGGVIRATSVEGSRTLAVSQVPYGTVIVGSYILNQSNIDGSNPPAGAYNLQWPTYNGNQAADVDINATPAKQPTNTLAVNTTDLTTGLTVPVDPVRIIGLDGSNYITNYKIPYNITNGLWYALEPYPKIFKIGPFTSSGGYDTYTITSTADNPTLIGLWPTMDNCKMSVQVHGRNSYGIGDYATAYDVNGLPTAPSTADGHTIIQSERNQNLIMRTVFNDSAYQGGGSVNSPPIYIFSLGINNIIPTFTTSPSRQYTPAQYKTALETLVTAFTRSSNYNYGRVILTVPLIPLNLYTPLPPYGDYRKVIIDLAKSNSWSYIDLSRIQLTSADYDMIIPPSEPRNDGLHPGASGALKIAKYIINMLEL